MSNNTIRDELLLITGEYPLLRKLMSSEEIREANKLVKEGLMTKGKCDDGSGLVVYYCDV